MARHEVLDAWLSGHSGVEDRQVPLAELAAVPAVISVQGSALRITTHLWRDFVPMSLPGGKPLVVVEAVEATQLPAGLAATRIAVVHERRVWVAPSVEEQPSRRTDKRFEVISRGGPVWGPEVAVDVMLQLQDAAGRTHHLRTPEQMIKRTD
ncbi:hypothetical protein [Streptomyces sp. NPDC001604]|uniref:hypothetical protein n=1 Tax=Streptomyces sp. NPDC001604 TaxID=3364593 RepID=UPI00369FF813